MFFPDQRKLLAACQGFDLQFPPQCVSFCPDAFGIDQFYRTAGRGISTALPFVMDGDAPFDIIRDPRIKRIIPAADDIAVIRSQFRSFFRNKPPKKVCAIVSAGAGIREEVIPVLFF